MPEKRIEPGPLTTQVSKSISKIRKERRITYAEIAEKLASMGRTIPVLGLSRMENGDRRVDLDDLVAIAAALRVPPVWLLFPVGQDQSDIEVLPGVRIPVEAALAWFIGDHEAFRNTFGHGHYDGNSGLFARYELPDGIDTNWSEEVRPLWLYRQHQRYVLDWHEMWPRVIRAQEASDQPAGKVTFALAAQTEENLRLVRNEMRRLGLPLPLLPEGGLRERLGGKAEGGGVGAKEE